MGSVRTRHLNREAQRRHRYGDPYFRVERSKQGEHPHCGECSEPIEGCTGRFGEWMHSRTRRERGEDGHLARPETAIELQRRWRGAA